MFEIPGICYLVDCSSISEETSSLTSCIVDFHGGKYPQSYYDMSLCIFSRSNVFSACR